MKLAEEKTKRNKRLFCNNRKLAASSSRREKTGMLQEKRRHLQ
ncbi:hypothetical protein [Rhodocyclus tenuis]|uniref:Uncharacterized protein n=1 Tax=Rhodocyclus tenuis TaxID=1066 RepID=A0A840G676_RHOTE|nr:hypothetical protein [Rhodocyclus tenuis]MBB4247385.1 hypothetical protein [Rhodocyclus tenuis]